MRIYNHNCGALLLVGLCSLALFLGGCSEKAGQGRYPNLAPDTFISYGPKEETCNYYKVEAYWYGTDLDGAVRDFEVATIRGSTLEAFSNLDYEALPWVLTRAKDSVFVLAADSCCLSGGEAWLGFAYWGIVVRAVDNEGARDPVPASLFFQTCNQVPEVRITIPDVPYAVPPRGLPSQFYLEWRGIDGDGDRANMVYKYLVIPEEDVAGGTWPPDPGVPHPWLPLIDQDSSEADVVEESLWLPCAVDEGNWAPAASSAPLGRSDRDGTAAAEGIGVRPSGDRSKRKRKTRKKRKRR